MTPYFQRKYAHVLFRHVNCTKQMPINDSGNIMARERKGDQLGRKTGFTNSCNQFRSLQ